MGAPLFLPSLSFADASQFTPRIYKYGGDLQINMAYEHNANVTPTGGLRTTDTTLEERLLFYAAGYIYHPRFISFDGFLGGDLRQEKFESNTTDNSPWTSGTGNEYGLRVRILPKHRYSLELWTERREPLVMGRLTSAYRPVLYERGALFRYKRRPASLSLRYVEKISEYGTSTVYAVSRSANGSYSIGPFVNSASSGHTESLSTPSQARTNQTYSSFTNELYFRDASFTSHIDMNDRKQESPLSSLIFTEDRLCWNEDARLSLPWNFQTSGGYGYERDIITQGMTTPSTVSTYAQETGTSVFTASHRLYNSLTTSYSVSNMSNRSTTGEMDTHSQSLVGNYTKKIPWGRFTTGAAFRSSDTDIKNAPLLTNEVYTIGLPIPGYFDLKEPSVDVNSIVIWVKSPLQPNDLILLTKDVNYTVALLGNIPRITITALDPLVFPLPETYEFHVKYSIIKEEVEFKTTNAGYNIKFELFNNLINPYYGHSKTDQKVLTGSLPGGPQHVTQDTVGVVVAKTPFTFTEEYQSVVSNINPSRTLRSIADYRKTIDASSSLYAKAYYTKQTRGGAGESGYSEDTIGTDAQFQKNVPRVNLGYNVAVAYVYSKTFTTAESYLLSSSLSWKAGKLVITMSASISETATTMPAGGRNSIVTERYLLSISRRLF